MSDPVVDKIVKKLYTEEEDPFVDNTIKLDATAQMMLTGLQKTLEEEPPEANGNMPAFLQEETSMKHYEWQRRADAFRLLLSIRLVNLTMEQIQ